MKRPSPTGLDLPLGLVASSRRLASPRQALGLDEPARTAWTPVVFALPDAHGHVQAFADGNGRGEELFPRSYRLKIPGDFVGMR